MKALLVLERWVGKVESFFLVASLVAMLSLTLYSVAYRNLLAPFVLKLQASEMSESTMAPAVVNAKAAKPASAAPAAASVGTDPVAAAPAAAPSAGDLDDEPAAPVKVAAAAPAEAPSAGDLDDEPAAPANVAAAAPAAAPSAGDLDDEPAAPAKVAAAPAAAPSTGDLDEDQPTPPAPAVATAAAQVAAAPTPAPSSASFINNIPQDSAFLKVLKSLNLAWTDKVTLHLLLWVGFFGAAIAAGKRKHIKIDALSRLLPKAFRERLQILLDLVAATACFFLANAALKFMASETASGTVFYGSIPGWVGIVIIPVGFGLLMWHFLMDAVFEIALWAGNKTPELLAWKEELQRSQEEVA